MRTDRIEVHDEDLRALCVLAQVLVAVDQGNQCYRLMRLNRNGKTMHSASLEYDATRELWETAITKLIEAST